MRPYNIWKDLAFVCLWVVASVIFLTAAGILQGCTQAPCLRWGTVKEVGQCAYSKIGDFGDSECVALTENGVKVFDSHPFVKGEKACEVR